MTLGDRDGDTLPEEMDDMQQPACDYSASLGADTPRATVRA